MKHSLLTAGVLLIGLALFAGTLTVAGAALRQPVTDTVFTVTKDTQTMQQETIGFPYAIEGTPLTVEKLVVYEGPMLEAESDEPLVDVLALLLHNHGQQEILSAQVLLQDRDRIYRFAGTHIPAQSKVLLIETNNAPWSFGSYNDCGGTAVLSDEKGLSADEVMTLEVGMGEVEFTNLTQSKLTEVCVYHKNYLSGMDICIGGITYSTELGELEPGQSVIVSLDHYASGCSKIVRIEGERE